MAAEETFTAYARAEQMGAEIYSVAYLTHQRTKLSPQFMRDALQWALAGWQVTMLAARHRGRQVPDDVFATALADLHTALLKQARHFEHETGVTLLSPTLRRLTDRTLTTYAEEPHARN